MYTVDWIRIALDALMEIWLSADDQEQIAEVTERLDRRLAADPAGEGESRPNHQHVAYELPLGVRYVIFPESRRVIVLGVWRVRRPQR
jgi:hypothetical protein